MSNSSPAYLTLTEVSNGFRNRTLSPIAITKEILSRIDRLDGDLGSYTTVIREHALARAADAEAEIERGLWRGPLHGVPIAVKDLCNTSFAPTSAGMLIHRDHMPAANATVIDRLETAGAVILGKLTMTEGAFAGHHPGMKTPKNPWNKAYWTGASSSGSGAATAAGLCYGSLGSDTGGSIRMPSSACGLTGMKPTWGRVSRHGIFTLADSLDHIGPMTRTAADAAAILGVIAGRDERDPTALDAPVPDYVAGLRGSISGLRIGIDEHFVTKEVDPQVSDAVMRAAQIFSLLGARLVPIAMPAARKVSEAWAVNCAAETALAHRETYPARSDEYGSGLANFIEEGRKISGLDLSEALVERRLFAGRLAAVLGDVDVILIPVTPVTLPKVESAARFLEEGVYRIRFTAPFDMTGSPTITLQGGFDDAGLPIGFQLVGRHLSEDLLLRTGHAFQQATDWHTRHPEEREATAASVA